MPVVLLSLLFLSFSALADNEFCRPLNVGESFTVNQSQKKSKSKVEQKYTLKRTEDDVYEAYLNMDFKYKGSLKKDPQIKTLFEAKIDSCFAMYENTLTDELGRTIRIKRYNPEIHTDIQKPKAVSIAVQNSVERSHSRSYYINAGCSTFLHESLHLMGLADEYEENWMSLNPNPILKFFKPFTELNDNGPAYDCRALGPQQSVMSNHYIMDFYDQVFFSGEANVILYPNCQQRNDDYYSCSELAYRTSKQNGSSKGCGEVRDICKTTQWVLAEESPLRNNLELSSHNLAGRDFPMSKDDTSSASAQDSSASRQ